MFSLYYQSNNGFELPDMLESYGRCPFLPTEADNILDTCENGDRLGNEFSVSVDPCL